MCSHTAMDVKFLRKIQSFLKQEENYMADTSGQIDHSCLPPDQNLLETKPPNRHHHLGEEGGEAHNRSPLVPKIMGVY